MGYCSTETGSGIPLHKWPTAPDVAAKWTAKVKETRLDFPGPNGTKFSDICGLHFHIDQYSNFQRWLNGGCKNLILSSGSVPHSSREFARKAREQFSIGRKRGEHFKVSMTAGTLA